MKNYSILFILFLLHTVNYSSAQNFVDEELDGLAQKVAAKVDARNDKLKRNKKFNNILVEDFTDTEGKISKLGASLAEEFSLALSNEGLSFTVTGIHDLAEAPKTKNKFQLGNVLNGASKVIDGVTDDYDYQANAKNRDKAKTAEGVLEIGSGIQNRERNYKGIDAVVTGTLTESNDQYRLLIKVISTKSGHAMIANAKGFISKTPFILALEEEENQRQKIASSNNDNLTVRGIGSGSSNYSGGSALQTFASNNTEVELLELKQVGQNLECYFKITNTGPDVQFYLYGDKSGGKLIDSNNSYDYWASQVKLGELVDNRQVSKTLVTNNPVTAKVTFAGATRNVGKIAKLNVKCYGHGQFWIELRDIMVR